jgi:hypothetical protein
MDSGDAKELYREGNPVGSDFDPRENIIPIYTHAPTKKIRGLPKGKQRINFIYRFPSSPKNKSVLSIYPAEFSCYPQKKRVLPTRAPKNIFFFFCCAQDTIREDKRSAALSLSVFSWITKKKQKTQKTKINP